MMSGSNGEERAPDEPRGSSDEARALRVMVEELKREPPPNLPWDSIERRLMAEIARREERETARKEAGLSRAFTFAAAAAVMLLAGLSAGSGDGLRLSAPPRRAVDVSALALARGAAGARGDRDLLALKPGDVIEAALASVTFRREGAVAWTLAPGSRAVILSLGAEGVSHTVALERGSLRAEVTPRDPSEGLVEAFAVEVEGTRVAVHGTAFSVAREGQRVIVDVERGSVAVGPKGHAGETTGHLLVGPRRAEFSLDGGRTARLLPLAPEARSELAAAESAAAAVGKPESAHEAAGAPAAIAAPAIAHEARATGPSHALAPKAPPPEAPSALASAVEAPATLTVASVRAHLAQCLQKISGGGSSSVEVSISSTLHIALKSDGTVQSARFDPPLKPEWSLCAGEAIHGRFAEGTGSLDIPITMRR